jgi:hypothetical protein
VCVSSTSRVLGCSRLAQERASIILVSGRETVMVFESGDHWAGGREYGYLRSSEASCRTVS